MTPWRTFDERVRRLAKVGLAVCVSVIVAGLTLAVLGAEAARGVLLAGLGGLVVLPMANVAAALVEEIRRRDWTFVAAAIGVLAVLLYNVLTSF